MDFNYSCFTVRILQRMQKLCQLILVPFASLMADIVSPSSIKHGYFFFNLRSINVMMFKEYSLHENGHLYNHIELTMDIMYAR